ncbi:MAG: ketohydroxyglutarate aldolase [Pleurocapsa sp. SU_5_0]|nr:ketohydroxyglutarate aldolase [Pleurocapsa sp. SU_5_0]NJO96866.1 ketohydroxyglutarate aldolase [Pleurocapsa sp. CRU_1_2]NJR46359.1 ketohydroxyglutarate aldolase [Hyellaceae cyanobacterium CSU_1_1]
MSQVQISVSVDDAYLPQIEQISQQLQSSGMNVEQTLSSIGIINGSIDSARLNSLDQIEGIKNVESQQGYQLAPPNSELQ